MTKHFTKTFSLFCFMLMGILVTAHAQTLRVAIAANLEPVMKVMKADIKKQTGADIEVISGSSGNLATQIRNGAPFDIFLSADTGFPQLLQQDGFGIQPAEIYAQGVLIICSKQSLNFSNWPALLQQNNIEKIAIGNPKIAPYGRAAMEALTKTGIYNKLSSKFVTGESISQVNTYILQGAVPVGFTTLSLVKDPANKTKLYYKEIDPKLYAPIEQSMLLLKNARGNAAAAKVYAWFKSEQAKRILKQFGYHVN
ncbi:molybdate ABC transporter substrate-binding protein [Mucilaginibacter conchicola]|uniref:Molybdate ABC transporter substrate-binding protein n=1 Tax=Mucilaginibacter conchicola TaxID=2303333 RepID=A0A372NUQ1_9SPHI|nr:molybdate ABC transporter substrate-binding protein [Mucilaginibacter conchicola]RFZ92988.1 molybdate ABC transporter substrate-binding protein [Mucilaginibacter conchicola]